MELACGPALAGLDLLGDTYECREPFLWTACPDTTAGKYHAPRRQRRQALGDHPFHAMVRQTETLFDYPPSDVGYAWQQIGAVVPQREVPQAVSMEGEIVGIFHQGGEQAAGESGGMAHRLVVAARV